MDVEIFIIQKEKVADSKISRYEWTQTFSGRRHAFLLHANVRGGGTRDEGLGTSAWEVRTIYDSLLNVRWF